MLAHMSKYKYIHCKHLDIFFSKQPECIKFIFYYLEASKCCFKIPHLLYTALIEPEMWCFKCAKSRHSVSSICITKHEKIVRLDIMDQNDSLTLSGQKLQKALYMTILIGSTPNKH